MSSSKKKASVGFDNCTRDPDFVNDELVKWWLDESCTRYAKNPNTRGTKLDLTCFLIEEPGGYRTRVLVENGVPIFESQSIDGIGSEIDLMKLAKEFGTGSPRKRRPTAFPGRRTNR